jgi:hypothetical protein
MNKALIFFLSIAFIVLLFPHLVSATLFDSCDSLNPSNGNWDFVDDWGQKRGTNISLDYNFKVEGNASIHVKITNNTYWNYFYKRKQPGQWNFTYEPVIRFRIYPVNTTLPIYFGLVTGEPDGWGWNSHDYGELNLTPNRWNVVEVDLRRDKEGNTITKEALSMGVQLTFSSKVIYNSYEYYLDFIEIVEGPPLFEGIVVFNITSEGKPLNDTLVYLADIKKRTNSSGLVEFSLYPGNFSADVFKLGYLPKTIDVNVIENRTKIYSISLEKVDTTRPKVSKLHVDGKYLKDEEGNIIFLRGVNQPGFADSPNGFWRPEGGGIWSGLCPWNASAVMDNLKAMKAWGINAIRGHQTIRYWLDNEMIHYESGCNLTQPYRQNVKDVISMAAQMGMYYIFDPYNLKGYGEEGCTQDHMPFPPYTNNTDVIPNEDAFVEYWRSVASELKDYPNVIFEIYNEPVGPEKTEEEAKADWHRVWQKVINAIRSTGADQPIIIQWGYGVWVNLDFYTSPHGDLQWIEKYPFYDPLNNLIYSTHIYRDGGFCHRSVSVPSSERNRWQYDEINLCLNYTLVNYTVNALNKPLLIGEIGANMWYSGEDLQRELAYFNNTISIFNDWGISYTVWVWTVPAHMPHGILRNDIWIPPPNEAGAILINKINEGGIYAINFTGKLIDKNNNILKANITLTKGDKVTYELKEINGSYSLLVKPSLYNLTFNFSNFFLKFNPIDLTTSLYNRLTYVTSYQDKTSLVLNTTNNQLIEIYSPKKPKNVLKNNIPLQEYSSLTNLFSNQGWFYEEISKLLYINFTAT